MAVALDMDFNTMGRLSCSCGNKILTKLITNKTVVIIADNDKVDKFGNKPGKMGAEKLATNLTKYNKVVIIYPEDNIGDLRLWVNKKGKEKVKQFIRNITFVMNQK